jgi:hypothetical protein
MAGIYPSLGAPGRKIVSQCNKAARRKAAIQNTGLLTSAAYNLVLEWVPQRSSLYPGIGDVTGDRGKNI